MLAINPLIRQASIALLQRLCPAIDADNADAIAAELGDLPLALHLAGSFLAKYHHVVSAAQYLAELRQPSLLDHPSLQGRGTDALPTDREPHVSRVFTLSLDRLDPNVATDAQALALLARAALLAPGEPFPRTLLAAMAPGDDALLTEDGITRLIELRLLETASDEALRMHRLICAYAVDTVVDETAIEAVDWALIDRTHEVNQAGFPTVMQPIATHLIHAAQRAMKHDDERAAAMLNNTGYYLKAQGQYAAAQPLLERALTIREAAPDASHLSTAVSLSNLAALYYTQGQYAAAQPLLERALVIAEARLGASHPDIAISMNNLAALLEAQGQYDRAQPLFERALAIRESMLGANHPSTATSLNNLATLHYSQGEYTTAQPLYERALVIAEARLGASHPDTAMSLNNLAELFRAKGQYAAAQPLFERALAIREAVLGANHPSTATSLNNLAGLFRNQGQYDRARPLFERALAIAEAALGPTHPTTERYLNNLASLHYTQGHYDRPQPLFERALAINEVALGSGHPDTATSLSNLALLYSTQGKYEAARPLYDRVMAIHEAKLHPNHPDTIASRRALAVNTLRRDGSPRGAEHVVADADAIVVTALADATTDRATLAEHLRIAAEYYAEGETDGSPWLAVAQRFDELRAQIDGAAQAR